MSSTPVPRRSPQRSRPAPRATGRTPGGGQAATALALAPQRRPAPARRPGLRLVDNSRLEVAARRKRMRALVVVAGVVMCMSVFALAAFHAMLITGQTRLDELERQVAEEQATYESLRQDVAMLESPERIVTEAQRLGMVVPDDVTWLVPTDAPVEEDVEGPPPRRPRGDGQAPWAAMKPYLGGSR